MSLSIRLIVCKNKVKEIRTYLKAIQIWKSQLSTDPKEGRLKKNKVDKFLLMKAFQIKNNQKLPKNTNLVVHIKVQNNLIQRRILQNHGKYQMRLK